MTTQSPENPAVILAKAVTAYRQEMVKTREAISGLIKSGNYRLAIQELFNLNIRSEHVMSLTSNAITNLSAAVAAQQAATAGGTVVSASQDASQAGAIDTATQILNGETSAAGGTPPTPTPPFNPAPVAAAPATPPAAA